MLQVNKSIIMPLWCSYCAVSPGRSLEDRQAMTSAPSQILFLHRESVLRALIRCISNCNNAGKSAHTVAHTITTECRARIIKLSFGGGRRCWYVLDQKDPAASALLTAGQMTDSRDTRPGQPRTQVPRPGAKLISVDNILQYASDIPSQQRRGPPGQRPLMHTRTPSGRHPLDPKLSGRLVPQHIPTRSSKLSEKLVLLPETDTAEDEKEDLEEDEEGPPKDEDLERRVPKGLKDKSYAERLPKARRAEKLSRVTAYCTAQAYKMKSTAEFVKTQHNARTKLYDDCLYTVYHLPLLPGTDGYRVRSSPTLKSPGGKSMLDEEIERNELIEYHEGYFEDDQQYGIRGNEDEGSSAQSPQAERYADNRPFQETVTSGPVPRVAPNALSFGEMFVFSYGVVVFWNFTERQEKDILADLTFSTSATGVSLATRPLNEEDFETEEFHFEYNEDIPRPRVYNDMITLKSGDHMIKLAMSHAIAQSTKLSLFEERMSRTMLRAQYIPKRLALTGKLGMGRTEVVKMIGQLFTSRVDVNLCKSRLLYSSSTIHINTNNHSLSIKHARHPQLLLGLGTDPPPPLHRRPRIPRNQTPHPGPQRTLPRLPRLGRNPVRQHLR